MSKIIEYKAKIRTIKTLLHTCTWIYKKWFLMYTLYIEESLSLQSTVNVFFCLIELCILFSNFGESRFIPSDTLLMAALM